MYDNDMYNNTIYNNMYNNTIYNICNMIPHIMICNMISYIMICNMISYIMICIMIPYIIICIIIPYIIMPSTRVFSVWLYHAKLEVHSQKYRITSWPIFCFCFIPLHAVTQGLSLSRSFSASIVCSGTTPLIYSVMWALLLHPGESSSCSGLSTR